MYPVSAVLADKDIMLCISPGEHGSTYGGNPLGAAIAIEALNVIEEEALCEKSLESGKYFLQLLSEATKGNEMVKEVRGKGLLAALEVNADYLSATKKTAWHLCLLMKKNGLLAKPTHENIVRLVNCNWNAIQSVYFVLGSTSGDFKKRTRNCHRNYQEIN